MNLKAILVLALPLCFLVACNSADDADALVGLDAPTDTLAVGDAGLDIHAADLLPDQVAADLHPSDAPTCAPDADCQASDAQGDTVLQSIPTSDCCMVHAYPGCSDPATQSSVCMIYQHCCNSTWDMMCQMAAQNSALCSGATCGDQQCAMPSENCTTCPQDCGCNSPAICYTNACCTPVCAGRNCGDDQCGGSCGVCDLGQKCLNGTCEALTCAEGMCLREDDVCVPCCQKDCSGKECGDDGCGGSCGGCDDGNVCTDDSCGTDFNCLFFNHSRACDDGDPCTAPDACAGGSCVGGPTPPECILTIDLGVPFGVVQFPTPKGPTCFEGSKQLANCATLPFCSVHGVACLVNGQVSSVFLDTRADFGRFGAADIDGNWFEGHWSLSGPMDTGYLDGLPGTWGEAPVVSVGFNQGSLGFSVSVANYKGFPFDPNLKFDLFQGSFSRDDDHWAVVLDHDLADRWLLPDAPAPFNAIRLFSGVLTASHDGVGEWQRTLTGHFGFPIHGDAVEAWMTGELTSLPTLLFHGTTTGNLLPMGDDPRHLILQKPEVSMLLNPTAPTCDLEFFGDGTVTLLGGSFDLMGLHARAGLGNDGRFLVEGDLPAATLDRLNDILGAKLGTSLLGNSSCFYWSTGGTDDLLACGGASGAGMYLQDSALLPLLLASKPVQGTVKLEVLDDAACQLLATSDSPWLLTNYAWKGPSTWMRILGPVKVDQVLLEATLEGHANSYQASEVRLGATGVLAGRAFTGELVTDQQRRPTELLAQLSGSWKRFHNDHKWSVLGLKDPLIHVPINPATGAAKGALFDGEGYLLLGGDWPEGDIQGDEPNLALVPMKFAVNAWDRKNEDDQPINPPYFLELKPSVEGLGDAVELLRSVYFTAKWWEGWMSEGEGQWRPMGLCTKNQCGSEDVIGVYPFDPEVQGLTIRIASGDYPPMAEAGLGTQAWTKGLSGQVDLAVGTKQFSLQAYALWDDLFLVGSTTPDQQLLPSLLPGGVGPGLTHDFVNRIAVNNNKVDGRFINSTTDSSDLGNARHVSAWVKNDSWSPTSYLLDRLFKIDGIDDRFLTQVSISGKGKGKGRLKFRYLQEYNGGETWVRSVEEVVPVDRLVHVAVAWDIHARSFAMYVDGSAVEVEWGKKENQPFPAGQPHLFIGTWMDELDDFELREGPESGPDIMAHRKIQMDDTKLWAEFLLSLRFDTDVIAGPVTDKTGEDLLEFFPGAGALPWTPEDDVELLIELPSNRMTGNPGLWIQSGLGLHLPLPGGGIPLAKGRLNILDGTAVGPVQLANPLPILPLAGPGAFILLGKESDKRSALETSPTPPTLNVDFVNFTFETEAVLAFQDAKGKITKIGNAQVDFGCPDGKTCADKFADHAVKVSVDAAQFLLEVLLQTAGSGAMFGGSGAAAGSMAGGSTGEATSSLVFQGGQLTFLDRVFTAPNFTFRPADLQFVSKVDLGKPFGTFDFGKTDLTLTLKFADGSLCGKGSKQLPQGNCEASVCFASKGPSVKVVCDGKPACSTDAQCGQGKMCLGFLCAPKLPDWSPCTAATQCAGGACAGVCYTPRSVGQGGTCTLTATDQCNQGLLCTFRCTLGNFGCGSVCLAQVAHGAPCEAVGQCPDGAACNRPVFGAPKVCIYDDLEVGEGCLFPSECVTNLCAGGRCRCTPGGGGCDQGEFCDLDGLCKTPKADGATCCTPLECQGNRCSTPGCVTGKFGELTNRGHCYTPNSVPVGGTCLGPDHCAHGLCGADKKCKCLTNDDCPGKRCDILTGFCQNRQADGALCVLGSDCQSGHCGTLLTSLPECYTPGSRQLGQWCVATDHCASGPCELRCNFDMVATPTSRCTLAKMFAFNAIAADLSGCSCETRCTCDQNQDCPDGKWCGDYIYNGVPSGGLLHECRDPQGVGSYCNHGYECESGNCGACNFLGCLCLCGANSDCPDGHYCTSGACLLKKPVGVGCSNNGQCITNYCKSTLAGKVCAW
jgi:hypothetical protein